MSYRLSAGGLWFEKRLPPITKHEFAKERQVPNVIDGMSSDRDRDQDQRRDVWRRRLGVVMGAVGRLWRMGWVVSVMMWGWTVEGRAMDLYAYDLDSLVYMSPEIVEATVEEIGKGDMGTVEVTAVLKGRLTVGQKVPVIALDLYRCYEKGPELFALNTGPLSKGAKVFLFMDHASRSAYDLPKEGAFYTPVPSGVKWIVKDEVVGFHQAHNPGPYVADAHGKTDTDGHRLPNPGEYRARIGLSVPNGEALRQKFESPVQAEDSTWLLALLKKSARDGDDFWLRNHLAELACARLANLREPGTIADALKSRLPMFCEEMLMRGWGNPAGRDWLLQQAGNRSVPMNERMRYAWALGAVGSVHDFIYLGIGPLTYHVDGRITEGNEGYVTRVAQLALDDLQEKEWAAVMLRSMGSTLFRVSDNVDPKMAPDFKTAEVVLKKICAASPSGPVSYEAEVALQRIRKEAYDEIHSKCGPILSLVTRVDSRLMDRVPGRRVSYDAKIVVVEDSHVDKMVVQWVNVDTHEEHTLPAKIPFVLKKGESGNASGWLELPEAIGHGSYRVSLEFLEGERVVSRGYAGEVRL